MEDGEESPPQSKTYVVITLPPPDNPSYGKTISTFTIPNPYSSSSSSSIQPQEQPPHQNPQPPPLILQENRLSLGNFRLGAHKTSLLLLGISLFALILWACPSPQTLFQTKGFGDHSGSNGEDDDGEDDGKVRSFMFPLYPKMGVGEMLQKDIELKLGRFVEFDSDKAVSRFGDDGVSENKIIKAALAVESTAILPIKGGIYPDGLYYTYILLGSPPRPYFLDVDTGSDLAWVQCDAPCTSCARGAHPLYKPNKVNLISSKDSFCSEVQKTHGAGHCDTCYQCDYEIEYADHSSSMGVLARDDLHLKNVNGSLSKSKVVFGCAYDQQGIVLNSLTKTDGILGLSRGKVSLPSQLASQEVINNVIGHCLTSDVGGSGYMFLGDDFVPHRQMKWVPMLNLPATSSYVAETSKISYANKQLRLDDLPNGHVVFDSGSSYTYFTKQAYADFVASLQDLTAAGLIQDASDNTLPICWKAKVPIRSVQEVKKFFKPLTFQFGRKWLSLPMKLQIPPEGYLVVNNKGNVCLGILDGSEVHDGSSIILGDVSLRGQLVVYDNVNHLIGWMPSDCVMPQSLDLPPSL